MAQFMLPVEIWAQIRDYLVMRELRELSLTYSHLRRICARRLRKQRRIAHTYRWIDVMDAEAAYRWNHARDAEAWSQKLVYHDALFRILRGELSPTYIFSVEADIEGGMDDSELEMVFHKEEVVNMRRSFEKIRHLVRRAVEEAFWIDECEQDDFVDAICLGKEDQVLCLLIPLLTNLRIWRPPGAPLLRRTMERIARAPSTATPKPSPLTNLVLVHFTCRNGETGVSLDDVIPYAALPSVRRLVLPLARSYDGDAPHWPAGLPFSCASEVYCIRSSIIKKDISGFAQGFKGPCIMRQYWVPHSSHILDGDFEVDWDYLELGLGGVRVEWRDSRGRSVAGIEPGTRSETIELRHSELHDSDVYGQNTVHHLKYPDEMEAMLHGRLLDWKVLVQQ